METQNAIKLVKELKVNKLIPKYNDAVLQDVAQEVNMQFKHINETMR